MKISLSGQILGETRQDAVPTSPFTEPRRTTSISRTRAAAPRATDGETLPGNPDLLGLHELDIRR